MRTSLSALRRPRLTALRPWRRRKRRNYERCVISYANDAKMEKCNTRRVRRPEGTDAASSFVT